MPSNPKPPKPSKPLANSTPPTDAETAAPSPQSRKGRVIAFVLLLSLGLGSWQYMQQRATAIKMIAIPGGSFQMGSNNGNDNEKPVHPVTVPAFKMGETEVTNAQWNACVADGACLPIFQDEVWGWRQHPLVSVGYEDITQEYIPWLNKQTGQTYRLPSEAEWEYAARAGSTTEYSWEGPINCGKAQYNGEENSGCAYKVNPNCYYQTVDTAPVKSYEANRFGLYDMHGNVWEWTQDCLNEDYNGAPEDGSAWLSGDCKSRLLRGGSWHDSPYFLRSAARFWNSAASSHVFIGFRLAQDY